jgi:hypothetical protein
MYGGVAGESRRLLPLCRLRRFAALDAALDAAL